MVIGYLGWEKVYFRKLDFSSPTWEISGLKGVDWSITKPLTAIEKIKEQLFW